MAIERLYPQFGLSTGHPSAAALRSLGTANGVPTGNALPIGNGLPLQGVIPSPDQFTHNWQLNTTVWGSREAATQIASKMVGAAPTKIAIDILAQTREFKPVATKLDQAGPLHPKTKESIIKQAPQAEAHLQRVMESKRAHMPTMRTYGQLFGWEKLPEGATKQPLTAGRYLKNTVWEANAQPIRDIKHATQWRDRLPGLSRLFALGYIGFDILKGTKEAYEVAKTREDGSLGSRMKTWGTAAKTLIQKTFKGAVSWEAAGAGAALGTFLATKLKLPGPAGIALSIITGAATGAGAMTTLNYAIKDPKKAEAPAHVPEGAFKITA